MKRLLLLVLLIMSMNAFSKEKVYHSAVLIDKINNAAKTNNIELIKEYIKLGGDLDLQDKKGYSPLIFASYYGHEELANMLIDNNANPCLKDSRGNTALMGAIFKGNLAIAYKLMKSKCVINQKNNANQSALMYASLFNRQDIAKRLIDKGEKVTDKDINGNTAIEVARKQFNQKMVNTLRGSIKN